MEIYAVLYTNLLYCFYTKHIAFNGRKNLSLVLQHKKIASYGAIVLHFVSCIVFAITAVVLLKLNPISLDGLIYYH